MRCDFDTKGEFIKDIITLEAWTDFLKNARPDEYFPKLGEFQVKWMQRSGTVGRFSFQNAWLCEIYEDWFAEEFNNILSRSEEQALRWKEMHEAMMNDVKSFDYREFYDPVKC